MLYSLARPILMALSPESAHRLTITALKWGAARLFPTPPRDPVLETDLFGLRFPNPLGIGAGFDKDAEVPDAVLRLGCGFAEFGTVTPLPQPGNSRPRLFRLVEDEAVINRMGFNNRGVDAAAGRLRRRSRASDHNGGIVGANVGANKDSVDRIADYATCLKELARCADYFVINVSSPNTPGLRALQSREPLVRLITEARQALAATQAAPLLLKVSPDLSPEDRIDIAAVARETHLDGLIVSNTTLARPDELQSPYRHEDGGLSGRPLFEPSTAVLADFYRMTEGKIPLIGVGGIFSGADAYRKIRQGASLVQLYSALVFRGPGLIPEILRQLAGLVLADGFSNVGEAVGADHHD